MTTQEKNVPQKTARSKIQKSEIQKSIRRKLAVGWKVKVTRDNNITGEMKINLPSRIVFSVSNWRDSQLVLGKTGAEQLRGSGDMYYRASDSGKLIHARAPYISDREIQRIVQRFHVQ